MLNTGEYKINSKKTQKNKNKKTTNKQTKKHDIHTILCELTNIFKYFLNSRGRIILDYAKLSQNSLERTCN